MQRTMLSVVCMSSILFARAAVASCTTDIDCPGVLFCVEGECRVKDEPSPAPPPKEEPPSQGKVKPPKHDESPPTDATPQESPPKTDTPEKAEATDEMAPATKSEVKEKETVEEKQKVTTEEAPAPRSRAAPKKPKTSPEDLVQVLKAAKIIGDLGLPGKDKIIKELLSTVGVKV